VTFDGEVLVDGQANHPTRPAPFIRVDTESKRSRPTRGSRRATLL
jgi:hypothetical protein